MCFWLNGLRYNFYIIIVWEEPGILRTVIYEEFVVNKIYSGWLKFSKILFMRELEKRKSL